MGYYDVTLELKQTSNERADSEEEAIERAFTLWHERKLDTYPVVVKVKQTR